jgi:hypothetical protein
MPMGRIKIFDGLKFEACILDVAPQRDHLIEAPEFVRISRQAPAAIGSCRLIVVPLMGATAEIVDEVRHDVGCARLPREPVVFAGEHVLVEAESEFHGKVGKDGSDKPNYLFLTVRIRSKCLIEEICLDLMGLL